MMCRAPREVGWGDWLAIFIKKTAALLHIEQWLVETPDCGCEKRREKLNRFGRWVVKPFRRLWKALLPDRPGE